MYTVPDRQTLMEALRPDASPEARQWLLDVLLSLILEITALREAYLEIARENGIAPKDSNFAKAFRRLGITSHNGAGVTLGVEKLLQVWACSQRRGWRQPCPETEILKALGFTDEDIEDYNVEAEFVTGLS